MKFCKNHFTNMSFQPFFWLWAQDLFPLMPCFQIKEWTSVQRELVLTFREEKSEEKKYFPVLREVKREKK